MIEKQEDLDRVTHQFPRTKPNLLHLASKNRRGEGNDLKDPQRDDGPADVKGASWQRFDRFRVPRQQEDRDEPQEGRGQLDGEDVAGLDRAEGERGEDDEGCDAETEETAKDVGRHARLRPRRTRATVAAVRLSLGSSRWYR